MAKSKQTFNKKEKEKKRLQQRQEKAERMEERKANAKKGKSLEEMMAYIDEDGNISSTPPDPGKKKTFRQEDMQIAVPRQEEGSQDEVTRTGKVAFFNEAKGFGFINDLQTGERVFIHISQVAEPISEGDKVVFEMEMGPKGPTAIHVKKLV